MPKNKITDLRNHLFEQLERLSDEDVDLEKEIKRANAVAQIAREVINSAKVEVDFQKVVGGIGSDFIQASRKDQRLLDD